MMKSKRQLIFVGGAVAATVTALALGVTVNTLLLFGAALLCPAVMLFGMRGMGNHQCGHGGAPRNSDAHKSGHGKGYCKRYQNGLVPKLCLK